MKKNIILAVSFVFVFAVGFTVASVNKNNFEKFSFDNILNTKEDSTGDYKNIGNYDNGNYIYVAAANLVFNDFKSTFIQEDVKFENLNKKGENMLKSFNSSFFTVKDIDSSDYYIKSGYGKSVVEAINRESKEKFPNKTFEDLSSEIGEEDIIAYAYLYKKMSFAQEFNVCEQKFKSTTVKGFCGSYRQNIDLVKYFNKNKFIVRLKDAKNNDEIYLMKGYDLKNPDLAVSDMKKYSNDTENLEEGFDFFAPNLSIKSYKRSYAELEGKNVLNKKLKDYKITAFYENLNFDLNNVGATVENEAVMMIAGASPFIDMTRPKEVFFDNDFFVVVKQKNSQSPYLVLGIANTDFMSKK